jgi:putative membrane protein
VHLLALGIGLGAVWARGRALQGTLDATEIRRVLYADTCWGIAALLWIATGLIRAFGGFEKGSSYYLSNHFFWAKMGLLIAILVLELRPIIVFIQWRRVLYTGHAACTDVCANQLGEGVLVVLMVLAATGMARGLGIPAR